MPTKKAQFNDDRHVRAKVNKKAKENETIRN